MTITDMRLQKLDFWFKNKVNVLLNGPIGAGKTDIFLKFFENKNFNLGKEVAYFSAKGQFVGDVHDAQIVYFDNLNYEQALFVSHEIVNLKSWMGKKIKAPVFASYNCNDYTDPLIQLSFFTAILRVPFNIKEKSPELAELSNKSFEAAVKWYNDLDDEVASLISPKRFTETLKAFLVGGDIRDILPCSCNVAKLLSCISKNPTSPKLIRKNPQSIFNKNLKNENQSTKV